MLKLHSFTFNPFQENTYVVYAENGDCIIVDPGCISNTEEQELKGFIDNNSLNPVLLFNTHCHIDHILGNAFVLSQWNIPFQAHRDDLELIRRAETYASVWGLPYQPSPEPSQFKDEGDQLLLNGVAIDLLHVPGHSPGSLCMVNHSGKWVIGGDVLFRGSIGRTDLPGGDHAALLKSIREKLFSLPGDYLVYSGHGPETRIDFEKQYNPFF